VDNPFSEIVISNEVDSDKPATGRRQNQKKGKSDLREVVITNHANSSRLSVIAGRNYGPANGSTGWMGIGERQDQ
jgi:hypothetical protein